MKKTIFALLFSAICFTNAFATENNHCHKMIVQIANNTKEACTLVTHSVWNTQGLLVTPPPLSIAPDHSKQFTMQQNFMGPKIYLKYKCGNKTVAFTSKQNKCILWAGAVHGWVHRSHSDEGINANHGGIRGSAFWNKGTPGQSNWVIY